MKRITKGVVAGVFFCIAVVSAVLLFSNKHDNTSSVIPSVSAQTPADWYTVAANPQRTSSVSEEVSGNLQLEWYRPIEAYIPQNSQLILANDTVYVSTARGLIALYAVDPDGSSSVNIGDIKWRFDTELPLGNSPTVYNNVAYVGGFDKKLHALNANTGQHLWSFDGAEAGYSANPLVIQINGKDTVFVGNRDGYYYAIGGQGHPQQGQQLWKFKTDGPIVQSAAYKNGVHYLVSNNHYAYAVNNAGGQVWISQQKLPGDGYNSYWVVVHTDPYDGKDYVYFSGAHSYREGQDPGVLTVTSIIGNGGYEPMQDGDTIPSGELPTIQLSDPWAQGKIILDGTNLNEYIENKPWRRVLTVLDAADGREHSYDSDGDGKTEYAPFGFIGTRSGNFYPPAVGNDGLLYLTNLNSDRNGGIDGGILMSWKMGTPYFIRPESKPASTAADEPQAISMGGNLVYRNLCCDRAGDYFDIRPSSTPGFVRKGMLWGYDVSVAKEAIIEQAPDYAQMWWGFDPIAGLPGLEGNYGGNIPLNAPHNGRNGIYHSHGVQAPIIPYKGKLYAHRSNTILVYGTGAVQGNKGLVRITSKTDTLTIPTVDQLKARLEAEINKFDVNGDGTLDMLRPGYYNTGQVSSKQLKDYFDNPGDTVYTLTRAYPYLSSTMQQKVKTLLQTEFATYFNPTMYARRGWSEGYPREAMPLPDDLQSAITTRQNTSCFDTAWQKSTCPVAAGWSYPQLNLYALWKYVQLFPAEVQTVYNLSKTKVQVPANIKTIGRSNDGARIENVWEINGYIAGYIGFLKLSELVGNPTADSTVRNNVRQELDRLLLKRVNEFSKDTPWIIASDPDNRPAGGGDYHHRSFNIARNFMMMVPEMQTEMERLGLGATFRTKVQEAWDDYNYVAPYWFVSRYDAIQDEGVMGPLDTYHALFQAKAYILKQSYEELSKYVDAPAFYRGDLFYIDNLVAALDAPSGPQPSPSPTAPVTPIITPTPFPGDTDGDGDVDLVDLSTLLTNFGLSSGATRDKGDLDGSGSVNLLDLSIVLTNFGTSSGGTTPTPTATPTPAQSGQVITNIVVSTGKAFAVDILAVGKKLYTDKIYTYTTIPSSYLEKEYIQTANADKSVTVSDYLTFTLSQDASVYVAYDSRATVLPAWLNDGTWTATGELLGTNDSGTNRNLYKKDFPAGQVTLGGNAMAPMAGAGSNYGVVVIAGN